MISLFFGEKNKSYVIDYGLLVVFREHQNVPYLNCLKKSLCVFLWYHFGITPQSLSKLRITDKDSIPETNKLSTVYCY